MNATPSKLCIVVSGLLMALWLLGHPAPCLADDAARPLTNEDVLKMLEAKLPESVILTKIRTSKVKFDTSTDAIIELNKKGVSEKVLTAIINPTASPNADAKPSDQNPAEDPKAAKQPLGSPTGLVTMPGFGSALQQLWQAILCDGERRVQMKQRIPVQKTGMRFGPGSIIGVNKSYSSDIFHGNKAELRTTNDLVELEVVLPATINASDVVMLVRPKVKSDRRELDVYLGGLGASTATLEKAKVAIAIEATKSDASASLQTTIYRVKPSKPLEPGEYLLTLGGNSYFDFGVDSSLAK